MELSQILEILSQHMTNAKTKKLPENIKGSFALIVDIVHQDLHTCVYHGHNNPAALYDKSTETDLRTEKPKGTHDKTF